MMLGTTSMACSNADDSANSSASAVESQADGRLSAIANVNDGFSRSGCALALIEPQLAITSAECARASIEADEVDPENGNRYYVEFQYGAPDYILGRGIQHPLYKPSPASEIPNEHNIALVALTKRVPNIAPLGLGAFSRAASMVVAEYDISGPASSVTAEKKIGSVAVTSVDSQLVATTLSSCSYGSPLLVGNTVVGITPCWDEGKATFVRLDAESQFIAAAKSCIADKAPNKCTAAKMGIAPVDYLVGIYKNEHRVTEHAVDVRRDPLIPGAADPRESFRELSLDESGTFTASLHQPQSGAEGDLGYLDVKGTWKRQGDGRFTLTYSALNAARTMTTWHDTFVVKPTVVANLFEMAYVDPATDQSTGSFQISKY
ncbi:hypothetical protein AKJ09_02217 [Labilithrix luteola]|uniref:Peptidase S1 domain-containing protein n=1 Tax=Labilithrix luteola TaxID=1391654 RepID=A0A0K1PPV1_9BACT|nr:hypothetical protein AKJ09_02217 [Labilithrix luteola]